MTIREAQQDALLKMLNLNARVEESVDRKDVNTTVWKVLIYDKFGQDVISPSLRLGDLRSSGITLHMPLNGVRQPIPDVPAIYFVRPTQENIDIIAADLKKGLYDSVYLNFSSTLSRSLLEELASQTVASNSSSSIAQVYDQFLNYVCLESNLFNLELQGSYHLIHNPTTPESIIEKFVDDVVGALFSVIVTWGAVPIIKCPKGNVAEAVAKKLDSRLRDNILNSRTNLFAEKAILSRPVLVLLDRDLDLGSMLTHSWTYSTLFHDLLDMKLNRVSVPADPKKPQMGPKSYDIDVTDNFWIKNAACPLPEVGLYIEKETKKYKEEVEQVGGNTDDLDGDANLSTQALSSKIKALPELRKRKKVLDMHTAIATSLLNSIVNRQLDSFISIEESIGKMSPAAIIEIIKDPKKEAKDKLRLAIIFLLAVNNVSKSEIGHIEQALTEIGCSTKSINYVKQIHMFTQMTAPQVPVLDSTTSSNDLLGSFTSNFSKITEGLQSVGIGEGFGNLISGVRNLLPSRQELPVTQIVDAIMEGTQGNGVEDYLSFDPKAPKPSGASQIASQKRASFADAIVFVVGGGNYQEYHNLMDYAARSSLVKKTIMYGATELLTPTKFLQDLEVLGGANQ